MSSAIFIAGCFILDFIFGCLFPSDSAMIGMVIVPSAALVGMLCLTKDKDWIGSIYWAFIVGLISDFLSAGFFVLFAGLFIVCMVIMKMWSRHLSNSIIEQVLLFLSTILVKEALVYLYMLASKSFSMSIFFWLQNRCIPTLIGNILLVLVVLGFYDLKKRFDARKERVKRREETLFWKEFK